jgi:hypothetical protein
MDPPDEPTRPLQLVKISLDASTEKIQCTLHSTPFIEANYVALSYQWGSTERSNLWEIELNSKPFFVTSNLHGFLLSARGKGVTENLWIDAISIDQKNVLLRNEEVKRMGKIYSSAQEVWVWLGMIELNSSVSPADMFDLSQMPKKKWQDDRVTVKIAEWRESNNNDWLDTLQSICFHGYWSRIWVVQEFLRAKSIQVWVNDCLVQGDHLAGFIAECEDSNIKGDNAWRLCRKRVFNKSEHFELADTLTTFSSLQCFDWHDRVYALRELVNNGNEIEVDYSCDKPDMVIKLLDYWVDNIQYFNPANTWEQEMLPEMKRIMFELTKPLDMTIEVMHESLASRTYLLRQQNRYRLDLLLEAAPPNSFNMLALERTFRN